MLIRGHFGSSDRLAPVGQVFVPLSKGLGLIASSAMSWGGDGQDHWGGGSGSGGYGGGGGYGGYRHGRGQFPSAQPAHNPYEVKLPNWLESIMTCEDDDRRTSIIMLDTRDDRMVSPFQAWLVKEIMTNSASSINVLTERDHVMPPNSGYHVSLFANYTLDGIKATLAVSTDSTIGVPCAGWDTETARALSHEAFQPFSCEDLQRQRDPVPLDLPWLSGGH